MSVSNVWVSPSRTGWKVHTEGQRDSKTYKTQEEAIEAGRNAAKKEHSELIVQNKHGQIRQKDSFGNDPKRIKG